jgi:hypothetical protein
VTTLVELAVLCAVLTAVLLMIYRSLPYGQGTVLAVAAAVTAAAGLVTAVGAVLKALFG